MRKYQRTMTALPVLWEFHSDDATDALAQRGAFAEALHQRFGMSVDRTAAEIVFTELVGNVMRHAPGPIEIRLSEGDGATLEVIDSGPGFEWNPVLPPASAECGRGLYIISRLSREVQTHQRDGKPALVRVMLIAYRSPNAVAWTEASPSVRAAFNGHSASNGRAHHRGAPEPPEKKPNDRS